MTIIPVIRRNMTLRLDENGKERLESSLLLARAERLKNVPHK
jgi:hypothetical protein